MATTSEWGQIVEKQVDKRETVPIRDVPIEGDTGFYDKAGTIVDDTEDVPFDPAMLERDRERARARGSKPLSLPTDAASKPLSLDTLTPEIPARDRGNAFDITQLEELINPQSAVPTEDRIRNNQALQGDLDVELPQTPENVTINLLKEQVDSGFIDHYIGLETLTELGSDQLYERLLFASQFVDIRRASKKEVIALELLNMGHRDVTPEGLASITSTKISFSEIEAIRANILQQQTQLGKNIINEFVATQSFDNAVEVVGDLIVEVLPGVPAAARVGLQEIFQGELDIETNSYFLIGSRRARIREAFVALTPVQRADAMQGIIEEVQKLQADPKMSHLLRTFNVLEAFEATFTDGVLNGDDSDDAWDTFFGNIESAVEVLYPLAVIYKLGGKGLRGIFRTADSNTLSKVARVAGDRATQNRARETLQAAADGTLVDPDELAAARLARPEEFVDERTIELPGVREENARLDRYEEKLLEGQAGKLSRVLNVEEKQAAVDKTIDALNLGDRARVAPSMSTVQELADGVYINAIIAKHGDSGWGSFDELLPDLIDLDPNLENLKIMRRNSDGVLEQVEMTAEEFARLVTTDFENISDAALIARSAKTSSAQEFLMLEREAAKRAGDTRTVDAILGDEYFLQYTHNRFWHPSDKTIFGAESMRNTGMDVSRIILTPNAKFGDEIVGAFQDNYLSGAREKRLFEGMFNPYYNLNQGDKRAVSHMYEWGEDFGKKNGVAPTLFDYHAEFNDLTEKQVRGLMALRRGLDAQYEVFNRRLFVDYAGSGYKTARPVDPMLPRYHGDVIKSEEAKGGTYYDPKTQEEVTLTGAEVAQLYFDGGSVMKLDVAIDIPGKSGKAKSDFILLEEDSYKVGNLSTRPLEYYPNYQYRFYDDPYFIVKRQSSTLNGVKQTTKSSEAIKTAGSQGEGEAFLSRIGTKVVDGDGNVYWKDKDGVEYSIEQARNLSQGDNVLAQKQTINKEGRLFWDKRNQNALPNVNSERAELVDFTQALDRGTQLAARMNSEEDAIRALKNGFEKDFAVVADLKAGDLKTKGMSEIISKLEVKLKDTLQPETRARLKKAIEIAKYIRQMEGVESKVVPIIRSAILRTAVWAERLTGGRLGGKALQKFAMGTDPIKATRSVAFHAFMVYRPMRQLLLQMSQPLFLAGIDPLYVVSGKGLSDAIALRTGFARFADSGFNPGYSNKALAKMMGLKQDEFLVLLTEFEKSGALDVVDTHAFAGGSSTFHKQALPNPGVTAQSLYQMRRLGSGFNTVMRKGFDYGEGFNKIGTYNIAWRRVMKDKGYKSIKELTQEDWAKVKIDTDNLSLAMSRPNNAAYQSGLLSVTTQFLSFSHKVSLAMMGKNPALRGKDVAKLWASMFTLFGANMFGARDWAREQLNGIGLGEWGDTVIPDHPAFPSGTTVVDLLSAGLIQTVVNKTMHWTDDDWKNIDTENFTPVLNAKQFYEMSLEGVLTLDASVLFGPFGNRASAAMRAYDFVHKTTVGIDRPPAEKFSIMAKHVLAETFPQLGDITKAIIGYELGRVYHLSGESIELEPTFTQMLLKGVLGAPTMEETAYFRAVDKMGTSDQQVKALIKDGKRFLKQYHFMYDNGEISSDQWLEIASVAGELASYAPDGRKMEVLEGMMLDSLSDDDPERSMIQILGTAAESGALSPAEVKDALNQLQIPEEQKKGLMNMVDSGLLEDRNVNQEEFRRRIVENNPNARD